jgi:hypothetical protein
MVKMILILYLHSLYSICPVKQKWALLGSNSPRDNRTHVDQEGYDSIQLDHILHFFIKDLCGHALKTLIFQYYTLSYGHMVLSQ